MKQAVLRAGGILRPVGISRRPVASYSDWIEETEPGHERRILQRQDSVALENPIHFSILTLLTEADSAPLSSTFRSIRGQTYPHWEWCLLQPRDNRHRRRRFIGRLVRRDSRIRVLETAGPRLLEADWINSVLRDLTGDWFLLLGASDLLAPFALYEIAETLRACPDADLVYADHDTISDTGQRVAPRLKPAWSPETLLGENYIGYPAAVRLQLLRELGGFRSNYGSEYAWDLFLRLAEATNRVERVPKILYHKRELAGGCEVDDVVEADPPLGSTLVRDHLLRRGTDAKVSSTGTGFQRATWTLGSPPRVSVVIPNRDQSRLLQRCLEGLFNHTRYSQLEVIIVDSGSTNSETLNLYQQLTKRPNVKVLELSGSFNFSRACNIGARSGSGEILLFLNNDVEMVDPAWLEELVRWGQLPEVGVVGCKLLYPDGRLQHAGLTLGLGDSSMVGHLFYGAKPTDPPGVFGSPEQYRNVAAVTGACLLIRRQVFEELGGWDERFLLTHSDVALCLQARLAGYRNVYTPFASLIHHEGATRRTIEPRGDQVTFARFLRTHDLRDDPYFHNGLSALSPVPVIRRKSQASARDVIQREAQFIAPRREVGRPLDFLGEREVLEFAASLDLELQPLNPDSPSCADTDRVQRIYENRRDLQKTFPFALTPLGQRSFLEWLLTHGREEYELKDSEIWGFFIERAEDPVKGLVTSFLLNPEWQMRAPSALTADGWHEFVHWLEELYDADFGWAGSTAPPKVLRPLEEIRTIYQSDAALRRAVPRAFQTDAETKRLLESLRHTGALRRSTDQDWERELKNDLATGMGESEGVNVLANFCYPSGVQQAAGFSVEALRKAGYQISRRDVPARTHFEDEPELPRSGGRLGLELYDFSLLHIQPDLLRDCYERAGLAPRPGVYRIGIWHWELESAPPKVWADHASSLDELWAPTRFIAGALRQILRQPVVDMLPGVELPRFPRLPRSQFGIHEKSFVFLFMFDMCSVMERKNPLGLMRAFRQAFNQSDEAELVIKVTRGDSSPEDLHRLLQAAKEYQVLVIDEVMSREESYALLDVADCYASLHRSEGFGLTMAESMLLGKPVIATSYGGNIDFMTEANSLMVGYDIVSLTRDYPPYPRGAVWAEPSIDQAAELMRYVFENRDDAAALGRRARRELEDRLSLQSAGRRMARRLREIQNTAGCSEPAA